MISDHSADVRRLEAIPLFNWPSAATARSGGCGETLKEGKLEEEEEIQKEEGKEEEEILKGKEEEEEILKEEEEEEDI